jgi:outer membrane protein assembly factor BamA
MHLPLIWFLMLFPILILGQEIDSLQDHMGLGIYPAISYSPETNLSFGAFALMVLKNKSNPTHYTPNLISPKMAYTLNNQLILGLEGSFFTQKNGRVNTEIKYSNYPDYFFGIGNANDPKIKELYKRQFMSTQGYVMKGITSTLFAGALFDFDYSVLQDLIPNGLLNQEDPKGIRGGRSAGAGIGLTFDDRDHLLYPRKGKFIQVGARWYGSIIGSDYQYQHFFFDYRQYQTFFSDQRVLAFQLSAQFNQGNIPFYKLSKLGGKDYLRGIDNANLYTAQHSFYGQIEGRQHLFWRLGGVLFAGIGDVFDHLKELDVENLKVNYGIGGRFQALKEQSLNIRLDLGFTNNGQSAIYFSIKEAF